MSQTAAVQAPASPGIGYFPNPFREVQRTNQTYVSFTGEVITEPRQMFEAVHGLFNSALQKMGLAEEKSNLPAIIRIPKDITVWTFSVVKGSVSGLFELSKRVMGSLFRIVGIELFPKPKSTWEVIGENFGQLFSLTQKPYYWLVDRAIDLGIPGAQFAKDHPYLTQGTVASIAAGRYWHQRFAQQSLSYEQKIRSIQDKAIQLAKTFEDRRISGTHKALKDFFLQQRKPRGAAPGPHISQVMTNMKAAGELMKLVTIQDGVNMLDTSQGGSGVLERSDGELMVPSETGEPIPLNILLKEMGLERWEISPIRWALYNLKHAGEI